MGTISETRINEGTNTLIEHLQSDLIYGQGYDEYPAEWVHSVVDTFMKAVEESVKKGMRYVLEAEEERYEKFKKEASAAKKELKQYEYIVKAVKEAEKDA